MHDHHHDHDHEHDNCCCHDHHHEHDHRGCACCEGKTEYKLDGEKDRSAGSFVKEHKTDIIALAAGAVLFAAAVIAEHIGVHGAAVFSASAFAYIILGREVLVNTWHNIRKGRVFDENFLMTVATLAAFCIGDYPEAAGIMLFYRIGEMFEDVSVERSRANIAKAVDMRPETVCVLNGGEEKVIPASEAQIGDILIIKPGERIPLDGDIISGSGLLDTSSVTGESVPVKVAKGDSIYSGCVNMRGQLQLKVTAELGESMVSRILESVEKAAETKPQIDKFITKFAAVYTPIVVICAVAVAIIPPVITIVSGEHPLWQHWILTAVTFLVISCPCAMVISVPLAYFLGIGRASREGILFKSGLALEGLRKIKVAALDKTGTITKGIVEDSGLLDTEDKGESFEEAFAKKTVKGDEPKEDAKSGISKIRKLGIIPAMLTGDRMAHAKAIGEAVGINEQDIRAELLPEDKLNALLDLREKHGPIMFVGDGVNDAPVLAGADVGAAMGEGTDAAIEAADIVFMNSNVEAISRSVEIAGKTGKIAVENIVISLGIKLAVMVLGLAGLANIWFAVFADTGVAMLCILNSLRMMK
ncbi:MAG: HAD-IC family P-type ATPase [Firmicutes bacterium]|nr:HAD-IC family P-type ATPase [Bacillota bacterium]